MTRFLHKHSVFIVTISMLSLGAGRAEDDKQSEVSPVSFDKQIRPILQVRCYGCHQPARPGGEYDMTSFRKLLAGGETDVPAIVPFKPEDSYLIDQITPVDGQAEMPKRARTLPETAIDLVRRWITEGARDDTPKGAVQRFDAEHPPTYSRPPAIASLDYSPDGKLLAVAGFHEVLLHKADGTGLVARFIGLSERIESVRFSPRGKKLAVTGGSPAGMGELQIWDMAKKNLYMSLPETFDPALGASWSSDRKLVAYGCSDNTVRVVNIRTGKQVLSVAHKDRVLDTVFSVDGSQLVTVARDRTARLIDVKTQRLVGTIASMTGDPNAGIRCVVRHPLRDEILVGGADGVPRIYRMRPMTAGQTGDGANLLWELPSLPGPVYAVDISHDGTRFVAASSLDGKGAIHIYEMDPEPKIPGEIIKSVVKVQVPTGGVFAATFHPDGKRLAAAGSDGRIRLIDARTGAIDSEFVPVEVVPEAER